MSFFDSKDTAEQIAALDEGRLDQNIADKKREIEELNNQIAALKVEIEDYQAKYQKRLQALDKKQAAFEKELVKQKDKTSKELIALEERQNAFKQKCLEDEKEIDRKIEEFKNKKKELIKVEGDMEVSAFERRKKSIEKKLSDLRSTKRKQNEDFNLRMNQMKEEYDELLRQKEDEKTDLLNKREQLISDYDFQLKGLERNLEAIRKKHENALKELSDAQQIKVDAIQAKEDLRIAKKNEELESFKAEADALRKIRDDNSNDFRQLKDDSEKQYAELSDRYEKENARLLKENEDLEKETENQQLQLERSEEKHKQDHSRAVSNLDTLIETLTDRRNKKIADLNIRLSNLAPELRNQYEEYVGELDRQFLSEKQKRESELNTLQYNLNEEVEQLHNRNLFLQSRYKKRDEQYKKNIADFNDDLLNVQDEMDRLQKEYEHKVEQLNADIEKKIADDEIDLENKKQQYENDLENTRKEYEKKFQDISDAISQTKQQIGNVNREIKKIQKEAADYRDDFQGRKLNLEKDREAYLRNIGERKLELKEKIRLLQEKMKQNDESFAKSIAEIEDKKTAFSSEYEEKVAAIQADFDNQSAQLNSEHSKQLEAALNSHNSRLNELNKTFDESISKARSIYEKKKSEYEQARDLVDQQLNDIYEETQNKIAALEGQRNDFLNTIAQIKVDSEDRKIEHDQHIKQLEEEHALALQQMAQKQEEDLAKITEEYELIPTQNLQKIRDEYAEKQREYNENVSRINSIMRQIDEEETDVRAANQQSAAVADASLKEADNEYLRVRNDAEHLENDLNSDLSRRQQELEVFKEDLSAQIRQIKERKAQELADLTAKLQEEYDSAEQDYQQKQDSLKRQYDEKVGSYQDELKVKQDNYDTLINEINMRKEAAEKECVARYDVVAEKTRQVQQQLDELISANDLKQSELNASLKQKQESFDADISKIRSNYADVLDEKRKAYEEYISDVRAKCDNLKNEINDLEKRKAIENARLETYENEKRTLINDLKEETSGYIDNINEKVRDLVKQSSDLKQLHTKRVNYIKTQIAAAMSEYDNLLRNMPSLLSQAEGTDENDLTDRTRLFKDKLDALERSHNEIVNKLTAKRDESINKILADFDDLEKIKMNKLQTYEDEIKNVSQAYDALLKDEKEKQEALVARIAQANEEQEKFIDNMYNQELSLSKDYEVEKNRLAKEHQDNLAKATSEFNQLSNELKKEFDQLIGKRYSLPRELNAIISKYADIDNEIHKDEIALKNECNSKLFEMRKLIEDEYSRKKEQLSSLDILKDKDNSIFK